MPNEEHGSFSLGFTFGLLAGAAGFFVFGTERGKKAREQFSKQWHEAHKHMAKDPDAIVPSLREAYTTVASAVLGETPKKKKKPAKTREKKETFSGT